MYLFSGDGGKDGLGRDFEDACMAKLIRPNDLPEKLRKVLGNNNSRIIGTLINNLVVNSKSKDYLQFSDNVFAAMIEMKKFNYDKIYLHAKLKGQEERVHLVLNELFDYFLDILENSKSSGKIKKVNYPCKVFAIFLNDMKYPKQEDSGQIVSDFIAGMTDNFALTCFEDLFHVQSII